MTEPTGRWSEFITAVNCPDDEIDLARAALLIAGTEYEEIDVDRWVGEIDRLARGAPAIDLSAPPREAIEILSGYFAETLGFHGNRQEYADPRNSFLNDVIERRTGIPITLSLVYAEIG